MPCSAIKCLTSQLLLGIACLLVSPAMVAAQGTVETDRAALVALYDATGGDSWEDKTNWKSDKPLNKWYGIETDSTGRVILIDFPVLIIFRPDLILTGNNLTGSIPPEIGNLTNLETLNLLWNNLTGSIPPEIGNLTNLEILNLSHTSLTGSIPLEIGNLTNLEILEFFGNNLTGSIPSEIGKLTDLETLSLKANDLTDSIPAEIGNLSNLKNLNLSGNNLTGSIPPEIGNLVNLKSVSLGYNQLSSSIPSEIENLTNLTSLVLQENLLSGSIPPEVGNLISLTHLYLDTNKLTGSIPSEIGNLINLKKLVLSFNQLTGSIPSEMGTLVNLETLSIRFNQLTGVIPPEVCTILLNPQIYVRMENNPGLINNCSYIPETFINNRRKFFEIHQDDDPSVDSKRSVEFILLQENSYGRVWISDETFQVINISDESMEKFLTYIFSSIPVDSTKGVFEYASDLLGTVRKNYGYGNNGERMVDILCHIYDWGYLGLANLYGNDSYINLYRYNSSPFGPGHLVYAKTIAHEYTHIIHNAYGIYSGHTDFFIEGLAEWAADIIMFAEGNIAPTYLYLDNLSSGEPLFPPRPFSYDDAKIFAVYLGERVGLDNMKHLIQVCKPGGVCNPDNPDNGDWYQGIDGLDYAFSLLTPSLSLSNIVIDYHSTNFVNDPSVLLNGIKYGYRTTRYAKLKPGHTVVINFTDKTSSEKELQLYSGGVAYITYENPSNMHLSIDTNHNDITSLRLFKEKDTTKELAEMDGDVTEYTVTGDYDRVTLIAVHNNPRPDQPEITLNISATQNYDPTAIEDEELPVALSLRQNYPNPFNPSTFIRWAQPQTGQVRLSVYNMLGQEVAALVDEIRPAGTHEIRLDALGWTSGVYMYVLEAGEQTLTQKMILLK